MPKILITEYRPKNCIEPTSIPYVQHKPPYKPDPYPPQQVVKGRPFSDINNNTIYKPYYSQNIDKNLSFSTISNIPDYTNCVSIVKIPNPCDPATKLSFYCSPMTLITNEKINEFNRFVCNYPNLNYQQIKDLIAKQNALDEKDQCRIVLDPYSKWYSKYGCPANMPASIPFTQHTKETPIPEGEYVLTPKPEPQCKGQLPIPVDTKITNNRYDCDKDPYPIPPPPKKGLNPRTYSIPYVQHRSTKVKKPMFGNITKFNYCQTFQYLINKANYYIDIFFKPLHIKPSIATSPTEPYKITPSQVWFGWLDSSNLCIEMPPSPELYKLVTKQLCKVDNAINKTFYFVVNNLSTTNNLIVKPPNAESDMMTKWNHISGNSVVIKPSSTVWFKIYFESPTKYYVIIVNSIGII